jgi:hypothetical protein
VATRSAVAGREAAFQAILDQIDIGGSGDPGVLKIFDVGLPGTPDTLISDANRLVSIVLDHPSFGALGVYSSTPPGLIAFLEGTPLSGVAVKTGTALSFQIEDGLGNLVCEGEVGASADLRFDSYAFVLGATITITNVSVVLQFGA